MQNYHRQGGIPLQRDSSKFKDKIYFKERKNFKI